jgi:hypothetical protein
MVEVLVHVGGTCGELALLWPRLREWVVTNQSIQARLNRTPLLA